MKTDPREALLREIVMGETTTPGMMAHHSFITDECRANRGDMGAFEEAVRRMRAEYEAICPVWSKEPGTRFHVVLTVEPPERGR